MGESTIPRDKLDGEEWAPLYASGLKVQRLERELRDLLASVGELRLAVGALMERVERLEADCQYVKVEGLKTIPAEAKEWLEDNFDPIPVLTGSIDGLEGVFTVTPPPEWEA